MAVRQTITLMGDLGQVIGSGDRVLVKPNFNSPDPFPASTDLSFLFGFPAPGPAPRRAPQPFAGKEG
jgi:hypothetical protein